MKEIAYNIDEQSREDEGNSLSTGMCSLYDMKEALERNKVQEVKVVKHMTEVHMMKKTKGINLIGLSDCQRNSGS